MEELGEEQASSSSSSKVEHRHQDLERPATPNAVEGVVNITLPEQLRKITPAEEFVNVRHRWNTNEEIASILIAFDRHKEWLMQPQKIRPASGSMLLYNRAVVIYRKDGYCWKKRRNGRNIREDHMKLKVQGLECIYGSYVHSAILPTFHRRCYWLLQNPNIVLLHYLNVPYPETAKPSILSVSTELKGSEWTKEELVDQLRPMLSRVEHSAEQETDEEEKVEKILEDLLPLLMPRHESNKSAAAAFAVPPRNLASQPLILAPVSSAVSTSPLAPRRAASLTLIGPLTSQHDLTMTLASKGKLHQAKMQSQVGDVTKLLQTSHSEPSAQEMSMASQEMFHQPIIFHCQGQAGINLQSHTVGKLQQQQIQAATANCHADGDAVKVETSEMTTTDGRRVAQNVSNAISNADAFTAILQVKGAEDNLFEADNFHALQQQQHHHHHHHNAQTVNKPQAAAVPSRPGQLLGSNNVDTVLVNSDVMMVNAFCSSDGEDGPSNSSSVSAPLTQTHSQVMVSSASDHLNSSYSLGSLASSLVASLHHHAPPQPSLTFAPTESQGPVVQQQCETKEANHVVSKSSFQHQRQQQPLDHHQQQQQQNSSDHLDRQLQQRLAQPNHSLALASAAAAQDNSRHQSVHSSLAHHHVISSQGQPQHHPQQQQQPQQQAQAPPLFTLHLKPGDGTSNINQGFVLSLQGATLVTPQSVSMSISTESQNTSTKDDIINSNNNSSNVSNINNNSNHNSNTPSLNISDPSGLVLVASRNQMGELVLNRISNVSDCAPLASSSAPAPSQPAVLQSSPFLPSSVVATSAPGMDCIAVASEAVNNNNNNNGSMDVSLQGNPAVATPSFVTVRSSLSSSSSSTGVASFHQSQQISASSLQDAATTPDPFVFTSSSQAAHFSGPTTMPTFVANNCIVSSSNALQVSGSGSSNRNPIGSSMFCSSSARASGFSDNGQPVNLPTGHGSRDATTKEAAGVDSHSSSSFGTLFPKEQSSLFSTFEVSDMNKSGSSKMDVCSNSDGFNDEEHRHDMHFDKTHTLTDDLMTGSSRIQLTDKEMNNPASCDTLDGSFSSLPGGDLNFDDLLDLEDVGDLVTSPLSATDLPATSVCSWEAIPTCGKVAQGSADSSESVMSQPAAVDKSMGTIGAGMPEFGFCQQQQQQQQQQLYCQQMSPTSPNHPGAPPRSSDVVAVHTSLFPAFSAMPSDDHQAVTDQEADSVIKDFSPDWAFSKTSAKVLVAGPWSSETSQYTCVFDGHHIPAALIQPGLLRCFTSYHSVGYATLQVARDGVVISNCEIFEFRERETSSVQASHPEWFAFETEKLKLLLFERLDQLQRRLTSFRISFQDVPNDPEVMESVLVQRVKSLVGQPWSRSDAYPKAGQHCLTLLHLAAALDLAKLISCLIKWRTSNGCVALNFEVDALSVDSHSCTPLMWACGLGNIDAALTLYRWNALPLKMCNKDGILPLALARQKGFYNLANQIEQLERAKEDAERKAKAVEDNREPMFVGADPSSLPLLSGHMEVSCPSPPVPDSLPTGHLTVVTSSNPGVYPSKMSVVDPPKGQSQDGAGGEKEEELETQHMPTRASFPKPAKPGPKLVRRFSEQVIGQSSRTTTLSKRNSVDLLPSGQDIDQATLPTMGSPLATPPIRETASEPQLVVSPDMTFVAPPAPRLLLEDKIDEPSSCVYASEPLTSRMDTDELVPVTNTSPIIDVERISSDEELEEGKDDSKHQMVTLANQIIAAIPERIKLSPSKGDDMDDSSSGRGRSESHSSLPSQGSPRPSSFGDDSGISTPMTDSLAFEEYRYTEFGTPASSLSPDSTCLPSPYSPYSFTLDSPPPTTAEFTEYFNAPTTYMEKDFSQLTLSDQEQRKLYEAAKVIQNAYRHYRDKQHQQQLQQQKEIEAAVLIQSYYRRYKTYAYYKKMSHAAVLIQNQFRTYYAKRKKRGDSSGSIQGLRRESERLKKGRNQSVIIQQRFRSHYQRKSVDGKEGGSTSQVAGDPSDSSPPPQEASSQCPDENQQADADPNSKPDDADFQGGAQMTATATCETTCDDDAEGGTDIQVDIPNEEDPDQGADLGKE